MTKKKRIAVTGGAGFIGRCTAEVLIQSGYEPVVLDNFSTSSGDLVGDLECCEVDLCESKQTREAFASLKPLEGIIHFAAHALVSESCEKPGLYFRNNLLASLHVAEAAIENQIPKLVHSSSCTVYGIPKETPISERAPISPLSPYGSTKCMSEQMFEQFSLFKGLQVLNLRYFNPAGSVANGRFGERHDPETHLIPNIVSAFFQKKPVSIFGTEYPTPDGTCVRDFVHVEDLARAHILAFERMGTSANFPQAINLGSGKGCSVREVIQTAEKVLGGSIQVEECPPRPGDPPVLVADIQTAKKYLGWEPQHDLSKMIADHAAWLTQS